MSDQKPTGSLVEGSGEFVSGEATVRLVRRGVASRQGAIARHLISYSNYKSWTEKVRDAMDREEAAEAPPRALRR